jgi:hypothetical protein
MKTRTLVNLNAVIGLIVIGLGAFDLFQGELSPEWIGVTMRLIILPQLALLCFIFYRFGKESKEG